MSQQRTIHVADLIRYEEIAIDIISIGATLSFIQTKFVVSGLNSIISSAVVSKLTEECVVFDAGAKTLTTQNHPAGTCVTEGHRDHLLGKMKGVSLWN